MEPKHRFDGHVNRGEQVVAAADMAQFVRKDRLQLRRRQTFRDACGQEKHGTQ